MVEGLPPNGALARKLAGHHWQHSDFMLAGLVDGIAQLSTDFRNANRAENKPPQPYPDPVWRPEKPGAAEKRKKKERKERTRLLAEHAQIAAQLAPKTAEKG
ncbi:hypothetical protein ACFYQA_02445 [Streptomyces sp. NPDC005774]|uniref:hypothetical protein n=1 Tax=Streptomyces sp. NPDC005774 TaxID=3364728 RepID=UPI00367C21A6